jgi:threonine/homoserine/homoserine lactone efflux protein
MIVLFIKGIIIGWFVSIPMGPIGVLCVQRTLSRGRWPGIVSGMGAAAADSIFALTAGFGVNYIISLIENQEFYFKLVGSIIILLIGLKIYYTNTVKQFRISRSGTSNKFTRLFFSVFFLTLTNPAMVLLFIWLFATLNVVLYTSNYVVSSMVIVGVFAGGTLWWITLTSLVNRFRNKLKIRSLYWFNKISGGTIILFGTVSLIRVIIINYL